MDRDVEGGVVVDRCLHSNRRRAQAPALDEDRSNRLPARGRIQERQGGPARYQRVGGDRGDRAVIARHGHITLARRSDTERNVHADLQVEPDLHVGSVELNVRRGDGRRDLLQVARCREAGRRHDADRRRAGVGRVELHALQRIIGVEDRRAVNDRADRAVRAGDADADRRKPAAERLCRNDIVRRWIQPHRLHT